MDQQVGRDISHELLLLVYISIRISSPSNQDIGGLPGYELAELIYNYQEPIMIKAAAAEEAERKDHHYQ